MESPCKDCLTFVMCRQRFEKEYLRYLSTYSHLSITGNFHSVWHAFNTMTKDVKCVKGRKYADIVFKSALCNYRNRNKKHEYIITELLKTMNLTNLYKQREP